MKKVNIKGKAANVYVYSDHNELYRAAADQVISRLVAKPDLLLGLATGSTPVPLYDILVEKNKEGIIDFANVNTYNLDEYYPIARKDPNSFVQFMHDNLFDKINLPAENIHIPNAEAPDADAEAIRYERELEKTGGVDIQVLGIGSDGHIGFNEPCDSYIYPTHQVTLTKETISDNSRFFDSEDEVPKHAITMGMGAIMRAKKCILIATGKNKAQAVKNALVDDASPNCPASILQFHRDVDFYLDEDAASLIF